MTESVDAALWKNPQYDGPYVVVNYDDYVLDDYNVLYLFECPFGWHQRPSPGGGTRRSSATLRQSPTTSSTRTMCLFVRTLAGTHVRYANLANVKDDSETIAMDDARAAWTFSRAATRTTTLPSTSAGTDANNGSFESAALVPLRRQGLTGPRPSP